MPKLLMVTTISATLRAFLLPYARHFRGLGWQVGAMAKGVGSCAECRSGFDFCHEIAFDRNPLKLKKPGDIDAQIRRTVLEEGYDIVHVHTPVAAYVTRRALHRLPAEKRPKVVYTAHGFHFYKGASLLKNMIFSTLERRAGRWTDHLIVINREDHEAALRLNIVPPERLSRLPGIGLDFSRYAPGSISLESIKKLHSEMGLHDGDELFLMVAEFNPGKRHRDALSALAKTGRTNFHLAFAGTGPLEASIRRLAEKKGLERQVHFLGYRSDIPALMLSARATILPSIREGLSRSVMESICMGTPVLGADARGIRDLITDPSRGGLFPVGNPAALGAAMIMAVGEPCSRKPIPDPHWDVTRLIGEHERIYEALLVSSRNAW